MNITRMNCLVAAVVYVAAELPPGSDESGSSWANAMTNVAAACAKAAAQEGGGDVWLKTGLYRISQVVALASNLRIFGGFAGTETTTAEADPVAHPTVLHGDSSCFVDSDGGKTGIRLSGLTLREFSQSALTVGANSEVEVQTCRFETCGDKLGLHAAVATSGNLSLMDTEFVNCYRALDADGGLSGPTNRLERCTFRDCVSASAPVIRLTNGSAPWLISSCRFQSNSVTDDATASTWCFLFQSGGVVTDTVFEDNVVQGSRSYLTYAVRVRYERCAFRRNRVILPESATVWGGVHVACAVLCKSQVADSLFEGNVVSGVLPDGRTGDVLASCLAVLKDSERSAVVNTTFRTNGVTVTATDAPKGGTVVYQGNPWLNGIGVANCAFLDNDATCDVVCQGSGTSAAENKNTSSVFINSIFWSPSDGYVPFFFADGVTPVLLNCCVKNYDPSALPTVESDNSRFVDRIYADVPKLKAVQSNADGPSSVRVAATASRSCRRGGRPVWRDAAGDYWFYDDVRADAWKWRRLVNKLIQAEAGARLQPPDGVTPETAPIADAFGAARTLDRLALGPLNAEIPGALMLIR